MTGEPYTCVRCGAGCDMRITNPIVGVNLYTSMCFECASEMSAVTALLIAAGAYVHAVAERHGTGEWNRRAPCPAA